jgi:hypothetical protein
MEDAATAEREQAEAAAVAVQGSPVPSKMI